VDLLPLHATELPPAPQTRVLGSRQGDERRGWDSVPVRAHIPPAAPRPRPPGGLRGRYEFLRLSAAEVANPLPPGKSPSFARFLAFRGSSLFVRGGQHDAAWEVSGAGRRLKLGTPIFLAVGADAAAGSNFNGFDDVLCAADGPPATYAWSATSGRVLFEYADGN